MISEELEDCLLHLEHHVMGPECWQRVRAFYAALQTRQDPYEAYRQAYELACIIQLGS